MPQILLHEQLLQKFTTNFLKPEGTPYHLSLETQMIWCPANRGLHIGNNVAGVVCLFWF